MIAATTLFDRAEGERRKDRILSALNAHREVFVNRGRRCLLEAALQNGSATADDVRARVHIPGGIDPRCLGGVPSLLATAGVIRRCGYVKSVRPERNASIIAEWEIADEAKAVRWLRDHPDRPDPEIEIPTPEGAGDEVHVSGN